MNAPEPPLATSSHEMPSKKHSLLPPLESKLIHEQHINQ